MACVVEPILTGKNPGKYDLDKIAQVCPYI